MQNEKYRSLLFPVGAFAASEYEDFTWQLAESVQLACLIFLILWFTIMKGIVSVSLKKLLSQVLEVSEVQSPSKTTN